MQTKKRPAVRLLMIATLALGACAGSPVVPRIGDPLNDKLASREDARPGHGVIESIERVVPDDGPDEVVRLPRNGERQDAYRITARMDDGAFQMLTKHSSAGLRVGDRVRYQNGDLQRY